MKYTEDDLLPIGERVNPQMIADGLMQERTIIHDGRIRHVPLLTARGQTQLIEEMVADPTINLTRDKADQIYADLITEKTLAKLQLDEGQKNSQKTIQNDTKPTGGQR